MAILTMTTFVTLDGVMQAPGGPKEDPSGGFTHGGWVFPHADAAFGSYIVDIFSRASAFLLGRRTYEIFAGHWPRVTDANDPVATKLNALPKYVASKTLTDARWNNSTIVRDVVSEVRSLKTKLDGEVQVHGSAGLAQTLLEHGLVDEFNIATFPVVLGQGKRLFGAGTTPAGLELKHARSSTTGAVLATYRPAGAPKVGSFELEP
jgi:dihydrofolate reductase